MKRLAVEGLTAVGRYGIGSRTIDKIFDDLMFTYLFFILAIHKFCKIVNITYISILLSFSFYLHMGTYLPIVYQDWFMHKPGPRGITKWLTIT